MSDFLNQFHGDDMENAFQAFSNGLADYYIDYIGESATTGEFINVLSGFRITIHRYHDEINHAVFGEIARYMHSYGIQARDGVDEYKIIYFMGMRIAAFLARDGFVLASKVILFATVLMLDERLKTYTNGKGRPELKDRLKNTIRDGVVEQRLGSDGLYLIYKCAGNMLKDSNKK